VRLALTATVPSLLVLALRHDAFGPSLQAWAKTVSPSLNEGTQRYTNCNHIFLRFPMWQRAQGATLIIPRPCRGTRADAYGPHGTQLQGFRAL